MKPIIKHTEGYAIDGDEIFIGLVGIDCEELGNFFQATLNVGRIFQ